MYDSTSGGDRSAEQLALGLGWFSIALGVAELAAPRTVARLIGVREDETTLALLRTFGARELSNGFAILAQPQEAKWLWGRVGGDALDLACLGAALGDDDTQRGRTGACDGGGARRDRPGRVVRAEAVAPIVRERRNSTAGSVHDGVDHDQPARRTRLRSVAQSRKHRIHARRRNHRIAGPGNVLVVFAGRHHRLGALRARTGCTRHGDPCGASSETAAAWADASFARSGWRPTSRSAKTSAASSNCSKPARSPCRTGQDFGVRRNRRPLQNN